MANHNFYPLACPNQLGTLLLTPCPGTLSTSVAASLQDLYAVGASAVITLMTAEEMARHKVAQIEAECAALGMEWFHFPVEDEAAPGDDFARAWQRQRARVHQHLQNNNAVVIHCKGGSGRTGVVAAQILMERGVGQAQAVAQVKALRPNAFTHAVQVDYIDNLAAELQ